MQKMPKGFHAQCLKHFLHILVKFEDSITVNPIKAATEIVENITLNEVNLQVHPF